MEHHQIFSWHSTGDNSEEEEKELIGLLREGWNIIDSCSDKCAIHYVLCGNFRVAGEPDIEPIKPAQPSDRPGTPIY